MAGADFADFLPGETDRINGILLSLGLIE